MRQIKQIGLIANPEKPRWRTSLTRAVARIKKAGRRAFAPQLTGRPEKQPEQRFSEQLKTLRQTDLIIVIGGDGTMLGVARALRGTRIPILGINTGNLGFLTAAPMADLEKVLECIWSQDYRIVSRPFIEASIQNAEGDRRWVALNDFVINRGELSRMIQLTVFVDGDFLTTYQCDGLIVCSPTGSTAYSLSAGGPIISPETSVMTLTPICPHALSNRSVIVPFGSMIEVEVGAHRPETILTGDGQVPQSLPPGTRVQFRKSRHQFRILSIGQHSFFDTLREKMKWSGSNL